MDITDAQQNAINKKIDSWVANLLDLSAKNKLLYFKQRKSTVTIIHPELDVVFKTIVDNGKILTFTLEQTDTLPGLDDDNGVGNYGARYRTNEIGTESTPHQLTRSLYNLNTLSRSAREEQGVNILFLAFYMLHWFPAPQAEPICSPLILVPINLNRDAPGKPYTISLRDDDILVNPTLQEAIKKYYDISLPSIDNDINMSSLDDYYNTIIETINGQNGWILEKRVVLDVFSYVKQMIVKDLLQNREKLVNNPLIRAISVTGYPLPSQDVPHTSAMDLDDKVSPQDTFQVLDADSSQQVAIQAALSGQSFVLQGPPGTGKSQTIANIIAEFLARGKKVLFVSAKMAALEVVQDRLNKVGLGDLCLQVHSYKRNKGEVLKELGYSLDLSNEYDSTTTSTILSKLWKTRASLNEYIRAQHRPEFEIKKSLFDVIGQLASLPNAPEMQYVFRDITTVSQEKLEDIESLIKALATFTDIIIGYEKHPWYGCNLEEYSIEIEENIINNLKNAIHCIDKLIQLSQTLSRDYGVRTPLTIRQTRNLVALAFSFKPEVLNIKADEIKRRYSNNYKSIWRYIKRSYWNDSAELKRYSFNKRRPSINDALSALENIEQILTDKVQDMSLEGDQLDSCPIYLAELNELQSSLVDSLKKLELLFFDNKKATLFKDIEQEQYPDILNWLSCHLDNLSSLRGMTKFQKRYHEAEDLGVGAFVDEALSLPLEPSNWLSGFRKHFYILLFNAIVDTEPAIGVNNTAILNQWIEEFRKLDQQQLELSRDRIRGHVLSQRPANWVTASSSQVNILRKELNKKRRLKSLRTLFSEIPILLMRLRPCLMMSPLTVSQLLGTDHFSFDLVIFDEASQILPEEAVGTLIRGVQVVVAGDKYQLPPTSFFNIVNTDDGGKEDDDATTDGSIKPSVDLESILDELDAVLDTQDHYMLKWHYRSKDESLIAFSNKLIYENKLQTFPAPLLDHTNTGVKFLYVPEGIYHQSGKRNEIEAEKVANLIIQHYQNEPSKSLGVVAFSQSQSDTIQLILDQKLRLLPELQSYFSDKSFEPCFIKNLELVQGDERDVMMFSIGYARNEFGKFSLNMGPLNKLGGERRLNVAVTRARQKVIVVSSVVPEDINLTQTSSKGIKLLRKYMEYARDGVRALYSEVDLDQEGRVESPFEAAVFDALIAKGLQLRTQVGVSKYRIDMAVIDPDCPGRFILGIECDGSQYHASPTARERDRLRQQVLENLGWRIHRIWSLDWNESSEREIDKVLKELEECKHSASVSASSVTSLDKRIIKYSNAQSSSNSAGQKPVQEQLPCEIIPYESVKINVIGGGTQTFNRTGDYEIVDIVKRIVDTEGPIEISDLAKKIRKVWNMSRSESNESRITYLIKKAVSVKYIRQKGTFLWPQNMTSPKVRRPASGEEKRDIEQISLEEISTAIKVCLKDALSMNKVDLPKQVAQIYELRATSRVAERIMQVVESMVKDGLLDENNEMYSLK